ncbi:MULTISPECIES: hypothetical protein [Erwinia]|uniref:Uncharacterized protein n=1 Tax=Erwinia papayae TaxID=206499 RepID=A0ABV3N2Z5_9GAMM|nr:hypothetical protein [Erwinia mallotivora]
MVLNGDTGIDERFANFHLTIQAARGDTGRQAESQITSNADELPDKSVVAAFIR